MSYRRHSHVMCNDSCVIKRITENEYEILKYISDIGLDITPKIFELDINRVIMEKYDCNILDREYSETDALNVSEQLNKLIEQMHAHDILHNDLHEENIVLNLKTMTIKIIDFDRSKRISSLTQKDIDKYNEEFSVEPPCQTIQQVLEHELNNVCICF